MRASRKSSYESTLNCCEILMRWRTAMLYASTVTRVRSGKVKTVPRARLVAPSVIGLSTKVATPIALISAAAGIGLVVLRIRQNNSDNDDNNGAQV